MKQLNGVWLPDHEEHLYRFAVNGPPGEWTYQKSKLDAAVRFCKKRDVAIDIGGHCGLWARELCKLFGHVHSFEPVPDHRDCYRLNQRTRNFTLYPCALGEQNGRAGFQTNPGSSGDTWLTEGASVEIKTLDFFDLAPDFIKIDCEGYELFVLRGGRQTILKHRPVVIVEQKPGNSRKYGLGDTDAVKWLIKQGYKLQAEIVGDYILT